MNFIFINIFFSAGFLLVACKSANKDSNKESFNVETKAPSSLEFLISDYSSYSREHTILGIRANFVNPEVYKIDICQNKQCRQLEQTSFALFTPKEESSEFYVVLRKCKQNDCSEYKSFKYDTRKIMPEEKQQEIKSINNNIKTRYEQSCFYERIDTVTEEDAKSELDYLIKKSEKIEGNSPILYQLIFHDRLMHSIALRASLLNDVANEEQLSLLRENKPSIQWYPQSHYRAEDPFSYEQFRSQYDIYKDLRNSIVKARDPDKTLVVFDEGFSIGEHSPLLKSATALSIAEKMKSTRFKQDQLTPAEKRLFVKIGPIPFLKTSFPDKIEVRGTERLDDSIVSEYAIYKSLRNQESSLFQRLLLDVDGFFQSINLVLNQIDPRTIEEDFIYSAGTLEREKIALDEMSKYLKDNPGKDVRLVYGGAHEFDEWRYSPVKVEKVMQSPKVESSHIGGKVLDAKEGKIPIVHAHAYDIEIDNKYDQLNRIRQTQKNFSARIKYRYRLAESQNKICEGVDENILKSIKIVFE